MNERRRALVDWGLVALSLALSFAAFSWRGLPSQVGESLLLEITLVPEDAGRLQCAGDQKVDAARCAFDRSGKRRAGEIPSIVPVVTTDRAVYLVAGLFEDDAVESHVSRAALGARFTVECHAKLRARPKGMKVRFGTEGPFEKLPKSWLARIERCAIKP